jgi:hypothetical protein
VLPLAFVLVLLVGPGRLGCSRAAFRAWREYLLVTGGVAVALAVAYARGIAGWREVEGVLLTAAGEEVVYRVGAVLLVGAACARLARRDWRDTASWGTGPVVGGLVGAALVFSVLPGHVDQMSEVGTVVPFASLAVLLGYASLRTGSILPAISTHVLHRRAGAPRRRGDGTRRSRGRLAPCRSPARTPPPRPCSHRPARPRRPRTGVTRRSQCW